MNVFQVLDEEGQVVDKAKMPQLPKEKLLRMYEAMLACRLMNERGMRLQRQGRIAFYIGAEGQEAAHVGFGAALEDTDWFFPHYRDLGVAYYRGASIESMVHQLYGSSEDIIEGRQMPNHFSYPNGTYISVSSPLTTQVPQAVGAAYASRVKQDGGVVGTSFGDGSSSEGDFHVAMNFAGVWRAPCVFLCQNNKWAISVPVNKQTASDGFAIKAIAYGFEGVQVDGNDILAVYAAADQAVRKARDGGGPTLIEAITYRMGPHSSSDDPTRYCPEDELDDWRSRDPLARFEKYMLHAGHLTPEEVAEMRSTIDGRIRAAAQAAEAAGPPPLETMVEHVYAEVPWHLKEQIEDLQRFGGEE